MVRRRPPIRLFVRQGLILGLLIALAQGCGGERPAVHPTATQAAGQASQARATAVLGSQEGSSGGAEAAVAETIDRIRAWGIHVDKADANAAIADPFLLTTGIAYATDTATLFVFPYNDQAAALAAAEQVPPDADDSNLRWAEDVDYFLCGRVIVLQYGSDGRAGHALRDVCGSPFASGKSRV